MSLINPFLTSVDAEDESRGDVLRTLPRLRLGFEKNIESRKQSSGSATARSDSAPHKRGSRIMSNPMTPRRRYFLNKDSSDSFTSDSAGFASLSHFDVILNSAAGSLDEIAAFPVPKTSYLRLYYCDYLSAPPATSVSVNKDGEIDVMDLQEWILKAEPRDRTQAYPLLVLAKKILLNLNSGRYRVISKRLRELEARIDEMTQHFEGERQRIMSVDQELLMALQKIERKRARSKAQKERLT
eukprot:CAMPEP_0172182856 /NCGR_PEP_ID=MMETSP1050-20130122/18638_1 /TAXON_ID=233186 /ORGANISM="Cryptomonas curvata, Strain CCAP979/52" /LENGTH=240 /DNA_ID=CAMNT_0012856361 /DNA_START=108 /DNA_END=826 /DNA_ORIENTATION=-